MVIVLGETDPTERLVSAIEKLDERMRVMQAEMNSQFAGLADRYMPRPEMDGVRRSIERELAENRAQIEKLQLTQDNLEERRRVQGRWAVGFAATVALLFIGLITLVVQHLPAIPTP